MHNSKNHNELGSFALKVSSTYDDLVKNVDIAIDVVSKVRELTNKHSDMAFREAMYIHCYDLEKPLKTCQRGLQWNKPKSGYFLIKVKDDIDVKIDRFIDDCVREISRVNKNLRAHDAPIHKEIAYLLSTAAKIPESLDFVDQLELQIRKKESFSDPKSLVDKAKNIISNLKSNLNKVVNFLGTNEEFIHNCSLLKDTAKPDDGASKLIESIDQLCNLNIITQGIILKDFDEKAARFDKPLTGVMAKYKILEMDLGQYFNDEKMKVFVSNLDKYTHTFAYFYKDHPELKINLEPIEKDIELLSKSVKDYRTLCNNFRDTIMPKER